MLYGSAVTARRSRDTVHIRAIYGLGIGLDVAIRRNIFVGRA